MSRATSGVRLVQIDAAGPFVVEQRPRAAAPIGFGQLLDLPRRERAGVVAVGTLPAGRIEGGQPAKMHRPRDRVPAGRGSDRRGFPAAFFQRSWTTR